MSDPETTENAGKGPEEEPMSRLQLIWNVLVFQVKLVVDGLRDVILVPVSLTAALLGLLTNPRNPGEMYEQVIKLGRRSEQWINLFGYRDIEGTSDELVHPLREKLFAEAQRNESLRKAGDQLNASLDKSAASINQLVTQKDRSNSDH